MAQNTVLVVGSLNMDQVVRVPRLPTSGETLLGAGSLKLVPGGKGANQAVALARLGARVVIAGCVGNDPFGEQLLGALTEDSIDTHLMRVDKKEASGVAFIFLTPDGENAIVVASGANMHVGDDDVQMTHINEALQHVQALVLQLEIPLSTVQQLIEAAHTAGVMTVLNVAPAQPLSKELLAKVSVLVVNESEAGLLSGQRVESVEDAQIVGRVLYGYGISTVVITLGSRGALLVTGGSGGQPRIIHQQTPKVTVVDTTAAGDCFVGALTLALTEKQTPEEALRFAVHASALKVTKFGAQPGMPTRKEVHAAYYS